MNKKFGCIPEGILGIELKPFEENEPKTLAYILEQILPENIISASYEGIENELYHFEAETENYKIMLFPTTLGNYFLVKLKEK